MSDIKVLTKYSINRTKKNDRSRFIWVYASADNDLAHNHPPVLDWQSGLENLEQLHTEPVEKKKPKKEEPCACSMTIVNIDGFKDQIEKIKETLKSLSINEPLELLERFLDTKNATYLTGAIEKTKENDLVSYYKLYKIAEKLKKI